MRKLFALAVVVFVSAGSALAQADPPVRDCARDPETTGALPADPRSLYLPGERRVRVEPDPPEVSWQDQFGENSEQRWRDLLDCGVD